MRQPFDRLVLGGLVLVVVSMMPATPSALGAEGVSEDAASRYKAAVRTATARFQKSVAGAQAQFVRDLEAARTILETTPKSVEKSQEFGDLPVIVQGADPVALIEGSGREGWFDVPSVARGAVLFETRENEPKDGVVQFRVTRDSLIGMAASWAYDGNGSGGWQEDRKEKKDLTDSGWVEVGHMYHNLYDRHTLFVRQCKKGEEFGIRTRKYRRPFVFIPGVIETTHQPADASELAHDDALEVAAAEQHATEEFLPQVDGVPNELKETTVFASPLAGVAIIRVHKSGKVYVAASWDYDGNNSGQWTEERWSKQKFLDRGWKEIGTVAIKHRGSNQQHTLFVRECNKGERFRLRTRKYGAPYVFAPPST